MSATADGFWHRRRSTVVLLLFAVVFVAESLYSYRQQSATMDEPIHLADGYFSLARADYRFDPEHPPLLRMYAALPLLFSNIASDTTVIDHTSSDTWAIVSLGREAHRFLYVQNDADRLLYRARFMIVLLGLGLGALVYGWALDWLGFVPAVAALAMVALEPNILAHFSTVSTDGGLTVFVLGALYSLWRRCRQPTWRNLAALCLYCALAAVSKFSAVLLFPIVAGLAALAVYPFRRLSWRTAAVTVTLVVATSYLAIWASYRFRYLPAQGVEWRYALHDNPYLAERVPTLTTIIRWVDERRLLPNVFSEGFLIGQAKAQQRRAYLHGQFSETGWWYFFPFAIAVKTPVTLLLLASIGLCLLPGGFRSVPREPPGAAASDAMMPLFLLVPIAGFLLPPMLSHLNIGLRHVLTIYPFLILLAALAVARCLEYRVPVGQSMLAAGALVWVLEFGRAYPRPLAFFNALAGGPAHGSDYLVDSNLDWGQDLKALKEWMDERSIHDINLAYFGSADPKYYGITARYLNGGLPFVADDELRPPLLPGYVAISATIESGALADATGRSLYWPLRSREPVAVIGHSIKVYWVDRPWW